MPGRQPVAEQHATGDTARIYHELRQTLRVSGVNLNFRTWAAFPQFFPAMWRAMQPLAASPAFESASDTIRATAARLALGLPSLLVDAALGPSQRFQIERSLALYHYVNPKLLLFTVLVQRGLRREPAGLEEATSVDSQIPFGPPPDMAAMEMVAETPDDRLLRRLFRDIEQTLQLSAVNSDYRTLALWPAYLEPAWAALKAVIQTDAYREAAFALGEQAQQAADRFPTPAGMELDRLAALGEDTGSLLEVTARFERLLPPLILNIGLLGRDWWPGDRLAHSPYPVTATRTTEGRR